MARLLQKAVDSLHATIATGIASQLRTVETDEGLAVGELTDPVEVARARIAKDNRTPLIQVFDENWSFDHAAGQRHRIMTTACSVVLTTLAQDADLDAMELFQRRYVTALIETIAQDPTLGGAAVSAVVRGGDSAAMIGDNSASRLAHVLDVEVRTHTP